MGNRKPPSRTERELERDRQAAAEAARVDYQAVARVYMKALRDGIPPTTAVAEAFGIEYANAGQRVKRARDAGYLDPLVGTVKWAKRCPTCGNYWSQATNET